MAQSNSILVSTTADSGAGSLRAAIASAQAGDTIRFAANLKGSTITLTSGQLEITKTVTIDGSSAKGITLSGNNASRVIKTGDGTNVTLKHLTIANGRLTGTEDETGAGAGIRTGMDSSLTLIKSQVKNNTASYGGGIYTGYRSNLLILHSKFDSNDGSTAIDERGGGAIATSSGGTLTVKGSSFTNNRGSNGGAINNLLNQLLVEDSVFRGNDSTAGGAKAGTSGYGGAIYVDGADSDTAHDVPGAKGRSITIRNSRIEDNRGAAQGGGIMLWIYGADQALVENCSITGNSVVRGAGGESLGGGLRHGNGILTVRNTTIANNTALDQGGGLWIGGKSPITITNSTISGNRADNGSGQGLGGAMLLANDPGYAANLSHLTVAYNYAGFGGGAFWTGETAVTLANSIVAHNSTSNPWKLNSQTGWQLIDGGNNIQFPAPASADDKQVTANIRVVDPKIAPLAANGGLTLTHALLTNSPALNGAKPDKATAIDQRGFARQMADIGAFEAVTQRTIRGSAANDLLIGTPQQDSLIGAEGEDWLMGHNGKDRMAGNQGADCFVFAGSTPRQTLRQSFGNKTDQITDFNAREGDRFLLDTDNDWLGDRPVALFHAGKITAQNLTKAAQIAYADKNQKQRGKQKLGADEAVLFDWKNQSYLSVGDRNPAFSSKQDLLVDVTNIQLMGRDSKLGALSVENYFL